MSTPATIDHRPPVDYLSHDPFYRYTNSVFVTLFAGAAVDQILLPEVSSGVEWTGRVLNPRQALSRLVNSAAPALAEFVMTDEELREQAQFLQRAHRTVKGVGPDGTRFSALKAENWNHIILSVVMLLSNARPVVTGERVTAQDEEAFYQYLLGRTEHLQLPAATAKLPPTYEEACAYYDRVMDERGAHTSLAHAFRQLVSSPLGWMIEPVVACSLAAMRPSARRHLGVSYGRFRQLEVAVIGRILPVAYRYGPRRLTMVPAAYHHWKYEHFKIRARRHRRPDFAPSDADRRFVATRWRTSRTPERCPMS